MTQAQQWCPTKKLDAILTEVGLPLRTYYRWTQRAQENQLIDHIVTPRREALPPTPAEVRLVREFAETHWGLGYKRLAYSLMLEKQAFLYPWMVHVILAEASLLGRRQPAPELLHRPPEADHPDQRWHTDLSMWYFDEQWYWLLDVLDAYSRSLIYCEVLITATAQDIVRGEQRALDTLQGRARRPGEPEIVHDGGPQFIGHEWKQFIQATGTTNVRTHPYHPQSNGKDERVHRTLRAEVPLDPDAQLYEARQVIERYRVYYNEHRSHSALHYLCPRDYYRGDPTACLAERHTQLRTAVEARRVYWEQHRSAVKSTT